MGLQELQREIGAWGEATFGHSAQTLDSLLTHLLIEAAELKTESDLSRLREEAADMFILLCSLAHAAGFSLEHAVAEKMTTNRARTWKQPDEHGVIEHK